MPMVKIKLNGKYDLILPLHRAYRLQWTQPPYWEAERIDSMMGHLNPGDIVFDIGAEEGDITALLAKKVGKEGGVVLFEPNPKVWPNVRVIWEANGLKAPLGCYVGFASDATDEEPLNLNISPDTKDGWPISAYGSLIGDHGFRHLAQEADATPQITLDEYCKRTGIYPNLITMDIEGAELAALRGAAAILVEHKPLVYVSIHPPALKEFYDAIPENVHDLMESLGYTAEHLATDHEVHILFRPGGNS